MKSKIVFLIAATFFVLIQPTRACEITSTDGARSGYSSGNFIFSDTEGLVGSLAGNMVMSEKDGQIGFVNGIAVMSNKDGHVANILGSQASYSIVDARGQAGLASGIDCDTNIAGAGYLLLLQPN